MNSVNQIGDRAMTTKTMAEGRASLPHHPSAVVMEDISKRFGKVQALDKVSFTLEPREVMGLVGENGAGKTTLMNILCGIYRVDEGTIRVWDKDVTKNWSTSLSISQGIGMIHQHFTLIPNHTVLENIVWPTLKWRDLTPPWEKFEEQIKKLCAQYGFQVKLKTRVGSLSMGEKQQVEILKALFQEVKILILDEPTSVLTPQQTESLLEFLLQLKQQGHSVVLVTHKLLEAEAVCDKVTVLRRGKHVGTVKKEDTTLQEIARMMVDRDWISPAKGIKPSEERRVLLETNGLEVENEGAVVCNNLSIAIGVGEIVGVAGVAGNGQIELAETLVGLRRPKKGSILLDGVNINKWSSSKRRLVGIGYIPEDRHRQGMVTEMSVAENLVFSTIGQPPFSYRGIIHHRSINNWAEEVIKEFTIKTENHLTPVGYLSGGNQQKIILARVLSSNPRLIVACQPARGLDFSTTQYIREKIVKSTNDGTAVLLISSDLDELIELSHRIVVMFQGKIVGKFKAGEVDLDRLGLMMAGHANH